jgi:acetyltransferase-like isoleucine patch superfamily enzyme
MSILKGENVVISEGCRIGSNVILEDGVYLDFNVIVRNNVTIKKGTYIGANSVLGEHPSNWNKPNVINEDRLVIGENSLIRSGAVIYGNSEIGESFQAGHNVTIRENTKIGNHCSVGTLSDIQGDCEIGNYVRFHSNVHVGMKTIIKDYVWVFPYVIFTNDPTPPSDVLLGVTVESFAIVATGSVILPGVHIASDSLVAAGAIVTKNVEQNSIVGGNPAKAISTIDRVKNKNTGENVYPWRYSFERGMPWESIGYDKWVKLTTSS